MLKNSHGTTIKYLSQSLELSDRTVYRYILLLEEVGFFIDKNFQNKYFIHRNDDNPTDLAFSPEESALIRQVVETTAYRHPLKEAILQKLYIHSELEPIAENLFKARLGLLVEKIKEGIQNEVQVILKSYHSANSSEISDRLVEPIGFQENYTHIRAYEPASQKMKVFKLERISEVILLERAQKHKGISPDETADIFGIMGNEPVEIFLKLSLRAYLLLREEFPNALPFLIEENQIYYFSGMVNGFQGVGRFILGLLDEIEVLKPESLQVYLQQKINNRKICLDKGSAQGSVLS